MWRKSARRDFSQRLLPRGHAEVSDTDQCELSVVGHSRRSDRPPVTSGLPPIADIPSTVPLRALSLIGALSYTRSSNRDSNLERIWFQVVPLALHFSKLY